MNTIFIINVCFHVGDDNDKLSTAKIYFHKLIKEARPEQNLKMLNINAKTKKEIYNQYRSDQTFFGPVEIFIILYRWSILFMDIGLFWIKQVN